MRLLVKKRHAVKHSFDMGKYLPGVAMTYDLNAALTLQSALMPGEKLLWAGRPGQGIKFSSNDTYLVPFSLFWGGFAIFWESQVVNSKAPPFFMLWGIPFVAIGLYLIAGRFFWDAYVRSRQTYAVTNQRLIVKRDNNLNTTSLGSLPQLNLSSGTNGRGMIDFSQPALYGSGFGNRGWGMWLPSSNGSRFIFLDDAQSVFQIIQKAQQDLLRHP